MILPGFQNTTKKRQFRRFFRKIWDLETVTVNFTSFLTVFSCALLRTHLFEKQRTGENTHSQQNTNLNSENMARTKQQVIRASRKQLWRLNNYQAAIMRAASRENSDDTFSAILSDALNNQQEAIDALLESIQEEVQDSNRPYTERLKVIDELIVDFQGVCDENNAAFTGEAKLYRPTYTMYHNTGEIVQNEAEYDEANDPNAGEIKEAWKRGDLYYKGAKVGVCVDDEEDFEGVILGVLKEEYTILHWDAVNLRPVWSSHLVEELYPLD